MRTFADKTGREWQLSVTIGDARRVQTMLDVNLLDITVGDPPLLTRLATDIILLVDVIWALVQPQAAAAGITDEQFGEIMGDGLEAANDALMAELADFFQRCGRAPLANMIQTQVKLTAAGMMAIDAQCGAAMTELIPSGPTSGDSPESSESIPAP